MAGRLTRLEKEEVKICEQLHVILFHHVELFHLLLLLFP